MRLGRVKRKRVFEDDTFKVSIYSNYGVIDKDFMVIMDIYFGRVIFEGSFFFGTV